MLFPLSSFQQPTAEFLAKGGRTGFGMNVSLSIRFTGPFSGEALNRSLALVMRRHEGLRMRLHHSEGVFQQYFVDPTDSYEMPVIPVPDERSAEAYITERMDGFLDLETHGPLLAELLVLAPNDHVLLLIVHHAATDAYADDLFITEILAAYDGYFARTEPRLAPAMNFSDYIATEVSQGERIDDEQLRYWRDMWRDCVPALPKRSSEGARLAPEGRIISASISADATKKFGGLRVQRYGEFTRCDL